MPSDVVLRPVRDDDYAFMRALYGSTREEEMRSFPYDDEQKARFLDQQFEAQTRHYAAHYPTAQFSIIERDGVPIGRLYIDRWASEIRLVDIALIAPVRREGLGTRLIQEVLDEGRAAGKRVSIHVEAFNPALHLYERLGFRRVDTNGVYFLMEWSAEAGDQVKTAS